MRFDIAYIFIISILGLILLYSYYYFIKTNKISMKLWGNISGNLLYVYYLSMLLSTIGFLFLFYYLITTTTLEKDDIKNLFYGLLGIVVISMLWMPLSLRYLSNKTLLNKLLIIIVLLLVAISTVYVIFSLNAIKYKYNRTSYLLALYGMLYFFFHAFFFDSILWTYNFF